MRIVFILTILTFLGAPLALFSQGSLTPPGAPSPTMKTLTQIEPRIDVATVLPSGNVLHVIGASGSYYLSEDIIVTNASGWGIYVAVPNVRIDMNGFSIRTTSGSDYAIFLRASADNFSIKNGNISGFDYGIYGQAGVKRTTVESIAMDEVDGGLFLDAEAKVIECSFSGRSDSSKVGIVVGESSLIDKATVRAFPLNAGIQCGTDSLVTDSNVSNCLHGIMVGGGSVIKNCVLHDNLATGINSAAGDILLDSCLVIGNNTQGIYIDNDLSSSSCEIINCNVSGNGETGIYVKTTSVKIENCNVSLNGSSGIYLSNSATVSGCTVTGNVGTYGIFVGRHSLVENCQVSDQSSADNFTYGIKVDTGSTVRFCTVVGTRNTQSPSTSSMGVGIYASFSCRILDCEARFNDGDGIKVHQSCHVSGNVCFDNGGGRYNNQLKDGAGIHATSNENVIDGNTVHDNTRGIDIDTSNNLIMRNLARTNAVNFDVVSGNRVADTVIAPSSPAILGSSGGSGLGTANPWANFSY